MKSLQQIFDQAWHGLKAQGWRKSQIVNGNGKGEPACRYRGPDGLRCAIGHVIPNSRYKPELEGVGASGTAVMNAVFGEQNVRGMKANELNKWQWMLSDLQWCHDRKGRGVKKRMIEYARHNGLTVPE